MTNPPRPWVRGALPWLRSGPLWRVHTDMTGELDAFVARSGYERIDLAGSVMTSRAATHAEIGRAFGFPDWYGNSWDAFNDCLHEFVNERNGGLVAVVVSDFDMAAAAAPATAAEVGWALLELAFGQMPTQDDPPRYSLTADVFVLGRGDDFDGPPAD